MDKGKTREEWREKEEMGQGGFAEKEQGEAWRKYGVVDGKNQGEDQGKYGIEEGKNQEEKQEKYGIEEEKKQREDQEKYGEKEEKKQREGQEKGMEKDGIGEDRMVLEIDSDSRNEEFARVVVAVFMSRLNPTLEEIDDVKTAISEAVTNAIIHGYPKEKGIIYIEGRIAGNELTVTVKDTGIGIGNLKKAMEPMYTSDESGERSGMGFSFMEAFMDQLEVESQLGKGTVIRMKKRIGG